MIINTIFKMLSDIKENRYAFATTYRKLYLPSVACR